MYPFPRAFTLAGQERGSGGASLRVSQTPRPARGPSSPRTRDPGSSTATARRPQPPRRFGRMRPAGRCSRRRGSALGRGHSPPACGQKKGLPRGVCWGWVSGTGSLWRLQAERHHRGSALAIVRGSGPFKAGYVDRARSCPGSPLLMFGFGHGPPPAANLVPVWRWGCEASMKTGQCKWDIKCWGSPEWQERAKELVPWAPFSH